MSCDEETLEHGGAERTLTISWDSLARLEAYEALGSVEYLAALVREHEANGLALDDSCNRHGCSEEECDGWEGCAIRLWADAHDEAERMGGDEVTIRVQGCSI